MLFINYWYYDKPLIYMYAIKSYNDWCVLSNLLMNILKTLLRSMFSNCLFDIRNFTKQYEWSYSDTYVYIIKKIFD